MGILDKVRTSVKRKALHVVRTVCNNCNLMFDDKYYGNEFSDHTPGNKKMSTGEHLVRCPYCDYINHISSTDYQSVAFQGRFRDYAEDEFYGTKFGQLPPHPGFNKLFYDQDRDATKLKFRDLNEIKIHPRKVA